MKTARTSKLLGLTLVFSMLLAGAAFADTLRAVEEEDDALVEVDYTVEEPLDLGEICPADVTGTATVDLAIRKQGNARFKDGSEATVSILTGTGNTDAALSGTGGTIDIPSDWSTSAWPNSSLTPDPLTSTVTLTIDENWEFPYAFSGKIVYRASGVDSSDDPMTADRNVQVAATITEEACGAGAVYFDGFHRPVDMDADFIVAKAGQGIPLKWNVFTDEGLTDEVTNDAGNHSVTSVPVACELTGDNESTPVADDAGHSGLRWDEDEGQYVFVWKTLRSWANTCRTFTVAYDDDDGLSGDLSVTVHFTR